MKLRISLLALLLPATLIVPASASPVPQPPELWTVTADGSTESAIATGPEGAYLSRFFEWAPDGGRLAFTKAGDIWASDPDGTDQANLTATDGIEESDPHWSLDGTEIVFVRTTGDGSDLFIAEADGSEVRPLTTDVGYERMPRWSPTGEWILFQSICVDCDEDLELIRPDGSERVPLTDDEVRDLVATWSPDGSRIAIVRGPGTTTGNELWVVDTDGTDLTMLATDVMQDEPEWSSDGQHVIARVATDSFSIVSPGGSSVPVSSDAPIVDWDWAPDGTRIVYSSDDLYTVGSDGTGAVVVVPTSQMQSGDKVPDLATALDWSPDGSRVAFSNGTDVLVWTVDGSDGLLRLTDQVAATVHKVGWSPINDAVAFLTRPAIAPARSVSLVASRNTVGYGGTFRFGGTVGPTDAPDACVSGVTVELVRMAFGSDLEESVATTTTDESGSFRFLGLEADRSADYVAHVDQTEACSEANSTAEPVRVRKKVTLTGPPISGGRVRLKAEVEPCKGHRGDRILLQKRKGGNWVTVARKASDDRCRAAFVEEVGRRSVFRAKAPKTDADHLAGKSLTLVIHVD